MRIIISPAKQMIVDTDTFIADGLPAYIEKTRIIKDLLKSKSYDELKKLWKCNDKIAKLNFERLENMNLEKGLTPAVYAYDGIQYKYMAPDVFTDSQIEYIKSKLIILSGFYGMVRAFDGVVPYRLEMQASLKGEGFNSLYEFWGDTIAKDIEKETDTIINLASKEYSDVVSKHIGDNTRFITIVFGELIDGKIKEKGTLCKMARGEMVRFMAENNVESIENIKLFDRLGFKYDQSVSDDRNFVFVKR